MDPNSGGYVAEQKLQDVLSQSHTPVFGTHLAHKSTFNPKYTVTRNYNLIHGSVNPYTIFLNSARTVILQICNGPEGTNNPARISQ